MSQKKLNECRQRISEIESEIESIDHGNLTADDFKAEVDRYVDTQAARFDLNHMAPLMFAPKERGHHQAVPSLFNGRVNESGSFDLSPGLCALFGTHIKDRLYEMIDAEYNDQGTLPLDQRLSRKKELVAELDRYEHEEENLLRKLESAPFETPRRPNARPEIILAA